MMSDSATNTVELTSPAPEHCPGTESKQAGSAAACLGMQKIEGMGIAFHVLMIWMKMLKEIFVAVNVK